MTSRRVGRLGIAIVGLSLGVSACADRPQTTELLPGPNLLVTAADIVPGVVTLCKYSPDIPGVFVAGADFTVSATGGNLPAGANVHVNSVTDVTVSDACEDVWTAGGAGSQTVTIQEVATSGVVVEMIIAFVTGSDVLFINAPSPASVSVNVSDVVGAVVFFKNLVGETPPPPPPPPSCNGLTPGYWKNWRNHYTESEFASLLTGTIAGSVAEADAIFASLGESKADPITKLQWFVLANQLTLNLVGTDLPNPDDADLDLDCANDLGDNLGDALELALDILADPGSYTKDEILDVKDILDYIANLGDD